MSKKTPPSYRPDLEDELFQAMRLKGLVLPQTVDDVIRAEQEMKTTSSELPPELSNPITVLERTRKSVEGLSTAAEPLLNQQVAENLARAARNGSAITAEVREKMVNDRKQAEDGMDDQ